MVLGVGLGVDSYGEYSAFDEPANDDRARGAAVDAAIESLLPMLAGDAVPSAGGRVTTAAGVQAPRVPIWVAGRAGLALARDVSSATAWKASRWSASRTGHLST